MGLDVYLYHYDDFDKIQALKEEFDKRCNAIWSFDGRAYESLTNAEKEQAKARICLLRKEFGIDEHEHFNGETQIEKLSKQYPKHPFGIGYFRSSYNEGGINKILENIGIPGLYQIFEPNERYEFSPDWNKALKATQFAITAFNDFILSPQGQFTVHQFSANIFTPENELPKSEVEAFQIFMQQYNRTDTDKLGHYTNAAGEFMFQGVPVYGLIGGIGWHQKPTTFVVVKVKKGYYKYYLNALEIIKETIEYVLAQPDPANYYLHWSA